MSILSTIKVINTKVLKENVVHIEMFLTGEPSNSKYMDFFYHD